MVHLTFRGSPRVLFIILVVAAVILGTIWHFLYDLSKSNSAIGLISPVNESPWEHIKILIYPIVIVTLIQYSALRQGNMTKGLLVSIVLSIVLTIMLFYTYTGSLTGKSVLAVDIINFVVVVVISLLVGNLVSEKSKSDGSYSKLTNVIALLLIVGIVIMVAAFTHNPPNLPVFKEGK